MTRQVRLDTELVRRGLAGSRAAARDAIVQGEVLVRGLPARRAATMVSPADPIHITHEGDRFVSRGGVKLEGALQRLAVPVEGKGWLDAGASTGGFTDCLLRRGATAVIAADVGYGQLDWGLRNDPRVVVLERINVRELQPEQLPFAPDGVVADLSFISLTLVLPALVRCASPSADHVLLVKPQFEVGREAAGRGVVTDPGGWSAAVTRVVDTAAAEGLGVAGCVPSPLRGPAGNVEFFLHLTRAGTGDEKDVARAVAEVEDLA